MGVLMQVKSNLVSGIMFAIISIILILLVPSEVPVPAYDNGGPSPRMLPYLVLYGILICSVGLIIQSVFLKKEKIIIFDIKLEKASFVILGLMILFGVLTIQFGFIIGIIIALPLMLFAMGERKPFIYIFTVVSGIGVYYLFVEVFNIFLPVIGG